VSLGYKDLELNVPLSRELFNLSPPPNARRIELDSSGHPIDPGESRYPSQGP
jgi:hypothetical protein